MQETLSASPASPTQLNADDLPVKSREPFVALEADSAVVDEDAASESAVDTRTDRADGDTESYAEFALPDGMSVDGEMLAAFTPIAQELGLTQDQAQRLVDMYAERIGAAGDSQHTAWVDMQAQWQDEVRGDAEIGGGKLDESLALARHAVIELGRDAGGGRGDGANALLQALEDSGLGNHPAVIRAFARAGRLLADDNIILPTSETVQPKTRAEILYPRG